MYSRPQVRMILEAAYRNTHPAGVETDYEVEVLRQAADEVMEAVERPVEVMKVRAKGAAE
jgi:hypothetical protein